MTEDVNQIEQFKVGSLDFVCEQDGNVERELKAKIAAIPGFKEVKSAYLVRVKYGSSPETVALCIDAPPDHELLQQVSSCFQSIFRTDQSLDVVFLRNNQVAAINRVAAPFYIAAK